MRTKLKSGVTPHTIRQRDVASNSSRQIDIINAPVPDHFRAVSYRVKKAISLCLVVVMLLSIMTIAPISVSAAEIDSESVSATGGAFEYEVLNDGTASITGYIGNPRNVTIPSVINGYTITSIGDFAFAYCKSIESVTIGNRVTSIGACAFYRCPNLQNITISNSVTSISRSAFEGCTSLKSIKIPNNVTSIGNYAFFDCESLESIIVPDSVTNIGQTAFFNTAYYNNRGNWEGVALYIDNHLIEVAHTIKGSYSIKQGTVTIASCAFEVCTNLTSITIPNSVTSIGGSAFEGCTSLTSITIPKSVTSIGEMALGYKYDYELGDYKKTDGFTIYGYAGTAAEDYSNEHGFEFIAVYKTPLGDVNGDGEVNILDATMVQKHAAELEILNDNQCTRADVNSDGVVDILDATLIQKFSAELIKEL